MLIYLLLAEHTIEIVADRGLNDLASVDDWSAVIALMQPGLRAGRFADALGEAVAAVDAKLRHAYPRLPGQEAGNELPDHPVVI